MLRIARAVLQTTGPYRQLRGAAMQCRESRCRCCASSAWEIRGFSLTAGKRGCRGISGRITLSGRTRYPKLRDHPAHKKRLLSKVKQPIALLSWAPHPTRHPLPPWELTSSARKWKQVLQPDSQRANVYAAPVTDGVPARSGALPVFYELRVFACAARLARSALMVTVSANQNSAEGFSVCLWRQSFLND